MRTCDIVCHTAEYSTYVERREREGKKILCSVLGFDSTGENQWLFDKSRPYKLSKVFYNLIKKRGTSGGRNL